VGLPVSESSSPVVRALDLGWGYTKFSRRGPSGALEFSSFPSLAPRHAGLDLSMSILGRRDTQVVDIEGTRYEVGPDSADLDTSEASRSLNDQFIHTEQYRAVFLGALAYIGEPVIDLLVVGLPLSNMGAAPKLTALVTGTHRVNAGLTVTVKRALVLPQPLGGLYYCLSLAESVPELAGLSDEVNLVIDPGFLTLDWVLARGEKVIETRSGAHTGGVSRVLRAIAESLSAKFGLKYENLAAIDKGLRRRQIRINGQVESLDEHIRNTRAVLEAPINYLRNIVGDGSDIDNILLLGGGSAIYRRTLEQFYPKHRIHVVEDAQLANARGFQLAGERFAALQLAE